MFFWLMLASLIGVVTFGNLREKTKDQEDFIAPIYQAMALNAYQQHLFAERGFLDAMRIAPDATKNYLEGFTDGVVPLVTVENGQMTDGVVSNGDSVTENSNTIYKYIQGRVPPTYKSQNNTRTYLFCIPKSGTIPTSFSCNGENIVKYIMTIRQIPQRYDGADKMTALKAISESTAYSRFIGMLEKAPAPLSGSDIRHQPLGAGYYILSSGIAPVNSVYIPNYALCNFPLKTGEGSIVLGDATAEDGSGIPILKQKSFIAALTLVSGLNPGENLTSNVSCAATGSISSSDDEDEDDEDDGGGSSWGGHTTPH